MVWMLLAGVVVFLLGMQMIEEVLRNSAGRSFKLFLRKHTSSKPKAVVGGALVTALLQGSSTVNMMVLAFSGAGVLPLENALAIVLGSNVGTTLDSWIVASLGFSLVGQTLPYALTAMAGIGIFFFKEGTRWKPVFRFFLGLGLLFIGLDLMKTSMSGVIETEWIQRLVHYPLWVYVFVGVAVTAVIQSSFAMVALTLSALFTGALEFTQAAALVLGAEVGTTLKFFIASLDGHPVKKQLALGNFIMNIVTAVLTLIFLLPITDFIQIGFGFTNELLALVTFQSLVNVVSLICFFPFLRTFSSFLQRRYALQKVETHYIQNILPTETEQVLPALENETRDFLKGVLFFIQYHFKLGAEEGSPGDTNERFRGKRLEDQYAYFKRLYGDIHHYYRQTRGALSAMADLDRADQLMAAVRNGMYAAKNMKDAQGDILLLQNSSNDFKYNYFLKARERSRRFCELLLAQLETESGPETFDRLRAMYDDIVKGYGDELSALYHQSVPVQLHDTDLSTIVNFNRELYTGYKSMLLSVKDFLLDKSHADQFDELPGFIR